MGATLLVAACILGAAPKVSGQPGPQMPYGRLTLPTLRDGSHDFDFLEGTWRFTQGLLLTPFTGPNGNFRVSPGRLIARRIDSRAMTIEWVPEPGTNGEPGFATMTYDRGTRQWAVRLAPTRAAPLSPPLYGSFENNIGRFAGITEWGRRTMLVHLQWTVEGLDQATMRRMLSADGGMTWEEQSVLYMSRQGTASGARPSAEVSCCPRVEAVWYSVPPGRGRELEALFDSESRALGDSQPVQDIALLRGLDAPNTYALLRGFWTPDVPKFYAGPDWAQHRATIERESIRADSAYELRYIPFMPSGFAVGERLAPNAPPGDAGMVVATVYRFDPYRGGGGGYAFTTFFGQMIAPRIAGTGGRFLTLMSYDEFGLNVWNGRETVSAVPGRPPAHDRTVYVSFAWYPDSAAYTRQVNAQVSDSYWLEDVTPTLMKWLISEPTVWRLQPVGRSRRLRDWREGLR
jgi:hypothetical protein